MIGDAAGEVGPALFFSLLIITLSFIPVFTLEAQEGRLFSPLAYTKTYAMAAAAGLAVTLVPVLMGYLIRGRIPDGARNPLNRCLIAVYRPLLERVLRCPKATLLVAALVLAATDVAARAARRRVHAAARRRRPAVHAVGAAGHVGGQGGGTAAADRPADQDRARGRARVRQGRARRDRDRSGAAGDVRDHDPVQAARPMARRHDAGQAGRGAGPRRCKVPGLANIWVPPIRNRIDMLATGIKSPVGIKVAGTDLAEIDRIAARDRARREGRARRDVGARRATHRRPLHRRADRPRRPPRATASTSPTCRRVVSTAIGGENIGETVEGLQRFPINVRYPREVRDSLEKLRDAAGRDRARRADPLLGDVARSRDRRRPADAAERERAAVGLGLRRHSRARSALGGARHAAGSGRSEVRAAGRLFDLVVRSVRVPGARDGSD